MINVEITNKSGVTLATNGKYCADNIRIMPKFNEELSLLTDIILNEDVGRISVDIDDKYKDFDTLFLTGTVNLSAEDWLYCAINALTSSEYTKKQSLLNIKSVVSKIDNIWNAQGNSVFTVFERKAGTGNLKSITFYTYTSGVNILTGSTLKIYGKKVGYANI
nr:hypothetical protein [uncultured Ruminococcus sp.]